MSQDYMVCSVSEHRYIVALGGSDFSYALQLEAFLAASVFHVSTVSMLVIEAALFLTTIASMDEASTLMHDTVPGSRRPRTDLQDQ